MHVLDLTNQGSLSSNGFKIDKGTNLKMEIETCEFYFFPQPVREPAGLLRAPAGLLRAIVKTQRDDAHK